MGHKDILIDKMNIKKAAILFYRDWHKETQGINPHPMIAEDYDNIKMLERFAEVLLNTAPSPEVSDTTADAQRTESL